MVDVDPTNIVAINVLGIFAFGYPVGYFLFYIARAVRSTPVLPVQSGVPLWRPISR